MKRLLIATLIALTGCGGAVNNGTPSAEEYRSASPSRQGISIKVPSNGSQALTSDDLGTGSQALLGQTAAIYKNTRDVTLMVNGGLGSVLTLCETIVTYDPTTMDDTHAVWGPWTDALSPNTYRFTVTKATDGYDYVLEGKAKTDPDTGYLALITGHHSPGAAAKAGDGNFTANWDNCQKLPEHDGDMVGSGDFTYSRNANLDVTVTVAFNQVYDSSTGKRIDAHYSFAQIAGGDGSFEFKSVDASANQYTIKSRWHNDGSGRGDAKAVLNAGAITGTENECWDSNFLETYLVESWDATATLGTADACVFTDAQYSTL